MKKVIPATTETICDICGDKNNFRCEAHLNLKRHGLDWGGTPVGDASTAYDLCDKCAIDIEVMLRKLVESNLKNPRGERYPEPMIRDASKLRV